MVLGESWTVLAVSGGGVCSFNQGKTAVAAGIAGANGRLRVYRSKAGVHARVERSMVQDLWALETTPVIGRRGRAKENKEATPWTGRGGGEPIRSGQS